MLTKYMLWKRYENKIQKHVQNTYFENSSKLSRMLIKTDFRTALIILLSSDWFHCS